MILPNGLKDKTIVALHHIHGKEALKHLADHIYNEMCIRIEMLRASGGYTELVKELNAELAQGVEKAS